MGNTCCKADSANGPHSSTATSRTDGLPQSSRRASPPPQSLSKSASTMPLPHVVHSLTTVPTQLSRGTIIRASPQSKRTAGAVVKMSKAKDRQRSHHHTDHSALPPPPSLKDRVSKPINPTNFSTVVQRPSNKSGGPSNYGDDSEVFQRSLHLLGGADGDDAQLVMIDVQQGQQQSNTEVFPLNVNDDLDAGLPLGAVSAPGSLLSPHNEVESNNNIFASGQALSVGEDHSTKRPSPPHRGSTMSKSSESGMGRFPASTDDAFGSTDQSMRRSSDTSRSSTRASSQTLHFARGEGNPLE